MAGKIIGIALITIPGLFGAAGLIFVRPDLSRESLIAKYADSRSEFLTLPDGSVAHIRIEGTRGMPVVALLHGAMSSLQAWDQFQRALANDYEVISLDLPGHGLTGATAGGDYSRNGMVEFVRAVLARLAIHHEAIIGHSMGGGVALAYAEKHAGEVWALVLIDANGIPRREDQGSGLTRVARNPFLRPFLRWATPRWLIARGAHRTFGDSSKVTDGVIDRIYELTRFPGNRAGLIGHYLAQDDDALVKAGLSALGVPTLVLWGQCDPVLPVSLGAELRGYIPHARFIVYPGVGHLVPEEAAEQSARDAADFLSTIARQAASERDCRSEAC